MAILYFIVLLPHCLRERNGGKTSVLILFSLWRERAAGSFKDCKGLRAVTRECSEVLRSSFKWVLPPSLLDGVCLFGGFLYPTIFRLLVLEASQVFMEICTIDSLQHEYLYTHIHTYIHTYIYLHIAAHDLVLYRACCDITAEYPFIRIVNDEWTHKCIRTTFTITSSKHEPISHNKRGFVSNFI